MGKEIPVQMIGVPSDHNSSYLRGTSQAPAVLRKLIGSGMSNLTAENGCDLGAAENFVDRGDILLENDSSDFGAIFDTALNIFPKGPVIFIGGDHSITWPIVRGLTKVREKSINLVHIDAHPDMYPDFEDNPYSHASPMIRLLEEKAITDLIQLGVRTINEVQRLQQEKYGVKVFPASAGLPNFNDLPQGDTYLSIDLDGIDPGFAPGVSHHEPGGLSVREVIEIIWSVPGRIIGGDIVELNPARDINDMTTAVVMKLMKEMAARILDDLSK